MPEIINNDQAALVAAIEERQNILEINAPMLGFAGVHQRGLANEEVEFLDEDGDGLDMDEDEDEDDEFGILMDEWITNAQAAIRTHNQIPNAPLEGPHMLDVDGVSYIWDNMVGLERLDVEMPFNDAPRPAEILQEFVPRPRRGNRAVEEDGRHMPAGLKRQPQPPPPPPKYKPFRMGKMKVFPLYGVKYNGWMFSRELDMNEKVMLAQFGYNELLRKVPELVFKEKDIPIDDTEECVILLSELADHLTVQACKQHIPDFSVETHTTEYQIVYKRYLKEISAFKRITNG